MSALSPPHPPEPRADTVTFDAESGVVSIVLKDGGSICFVAREHAELTNLSDVALATITTDHIGFYIYWRAENVSLYVPALARGHPRS